MIDWAPFDEFPRNTCFCRCGAIFRSHSKAVFEDGGMRLVTRAPCPTCKKDDNCEKISSGPVYTFWKEREK